jgi:hypothetical protein
VDFLIGRHRGRAKNATLVIARARSIVFLLMVAILSIESSRTWHRGWSAGSPLMPRPRRLFHNLAILSAAHEKGVHA